MKQSLQRHPFIIAAFCVIGGVLGLIWYIAGKPESSAPALPADARESKRVDPMAPRLVSPSGDETLAEPAVNSPPPNPALDAAIEKLIKTGQGDGIIVGEYELAATYSIKAAESRKMAEGKLFLFPKTTEPNESGSTPPQDRIAPSTPGPNRAYNLTGQLMISTDHQGNVTTYNYDAFSQMLGVQRGGRAASVFAYQIPLEARANRPPVVRQQGGIAESAQLELARTFVSHLAQIASRNKVAQ
jgi:YD repeat-containing protein